MKVIQDALLYNKEYKEVPLLSERLHSLLKTSKVHETLLDCGKKKQIDFFSF